jgi:hypothetical protein
MDYKDNNDINLLVSGSEVIKSSYFYDYINNTYNVMEGFYLSFGSDVDFTNKTLEEVYALSVGSRDLEKVKTTKTIKGFELYVEKESLPLDYENTDNPEIINPKYSIMFISYKDKLLPESTIPIKPILAIKLLDNSVVYGVNSTIRFDLDLKCSYFMNDTDNLSYMNNLESKLDIEGDLKYTYFDLIQKLNTDRNLKEVSSLNYKNGVLKY